MLKVNSLFKFFIFIGGIVGLLWSGLSYAAVVDCVGWEKEPLMGTSADTKPTTNLQCQRFIESDTTRVFYWDGSTWVRFSESLTSSLRINTIGSNTVKATSGELLGIYVASTSAGTISIWNDADATCNTSQITGTITPAVGWHVIPVRLSTGICALTGGTAIDVTLIYR